METNVSVPGDVDMDMGKAAPAEIPTIVARHFTEEGADALESVRWKTVDAVIVGANGSEKFRQDGVEVPEFWSEVTIGIVAEKYFRVIDGKKETSAKQMFTRVAGWLTTTATQAMLISAKEAKILHDELLYILVQGMYAFNSPVWFNVGAQEHPQCSACFIQSADDTMSGIMDLAKREVMLFKGGSGTGGNLSTLRSSHEELSRGGFASGPVSFMKGFDAFAGVTKSGGTTRRAAKMIVLNVDHPDIMEQRNGLPGFIDCKADAERQAQALFDTGKYTAEWNIPGNVYDRVGYQNANHSVRVNRNFMQSVVADKTWSTKLKDGSEHSEYQARDIWKAIAEAAHACGDPGVQFDTNTNQWHTCSESGRINASNPCSEYLFLDETACNLGSINLLKFADGQTFDVAGFKQAINIAVTAKELLVGMSSYPSEEITEMSHKFRTIGLGYTNLGALLTYWGLPYDSDDGRTATSMITALLGGEAYAQSARLARSMEPFSEYEKNRDGMLRVMEDHWAAAKKMDTLHDHKSLNEIGAQAKLSWREAVRLGETYGYRNAQTTVLAPCGTISFLMGCDTTGIEPMLGCVVYKKVVGGGLLTLPSEVVRPALENLGYDNDDVRSILAHIKETGNIHTAPKLYTAHKAVFAEALGDNAMRPEAHVDMMAAAQPFISGGISKTVNMPHDATVEDISEIYLRAWNKGLKCVAVFRDGCKLSQPINTKLVAKEKTKSLKWGERKRIDSTRPAWNHKFSIAGLKGYITTGTYGDGSPAEVFLRVSKQGSFVNGILEALATAVSLGLQHGVPLQLFVDKFKDQKFEPSGFTGNEDIRIAKSLPDYVFRWLEMHYNEMQELKAEPAQIVAAVSDEAITVVDMSGPPCSACGNLTKRSGACYVCTVCGDTTGCG
jgi:ribonucleoside-diphosphate reductase alpha chain